MKQTQTIIHLNLHSLEATHCSQQETINSPMPNWLIPKKPQSKSKYEL